MSDSTTTQVLLSILTRGQVEPIELRRKALEVLPLLFEMEHRRGRARELVMDVLRFAEVLSQRKRSPTTSSRLVKAMVNDPIVGKIAREILDGVRKNAKERARRMGALLGTSPSPLRAPHVDAGRGGRRQVHPIQNMQPDPRRHR